MLDLADFNSQGNGNAGTWHTDPELVLVLVVSCHERILEIWYHLTFTGLIVQIFVHVGQEQFNGVSLMQFDYIQSIEEILNTLKDSILLILNDVVHGFLLLIFLIKSFQVFLID